MAYENLVMLIGNLGADPENRFLPDGTETTSLRLATTKRYKDKNGEKQEHTEWHRVVGYSQIAKFAGEYAEKGNQAYIRGELRTRKWQDKDGVDRYTTEILCRYFQLLSGKRQGEAAETGEEEIPAESASTAGAESGSGESGGKAPTKSGKKKPEPAEA